MWKFYVKVFRASYFKTLWWILFMFGIMMDIGPTLYGVPSPLLYMTLRSRSQSSFRWKVLGSFYFQTRSYIWLDIGPKYYRVLSPCPVHDLKVKIMDLEFLYESFTLKFFRKEKGNSGELSCPVIGLIRDTALTVEPSNKKRDFDLSVLKSFRRVCLATQWGKRCGSLSELPSFEGRMWDLIVSVPDHCLSSYFSC